MRNEVRYTNQSDWILPRRKAEGIDMVRESERCIRTCSECGVAFIGGPKETLCPMHKRERRLQKRKDYRAYYKNRGRCYDCGKPVVEGKTRCADCLEKHRKWYSGIGRVVNV